MSETQLHLDNAAMLCGHPWLIIPCPGGSLDVSLIPDSLNDLKVMVSFCHFLSHVQLDRAFQLTSLDICLALMDCMDDESTMLKEMVSMSSAQNESGADKLP